MCKVESVHFFSYSILENSVWTKMHRSGISMKLSHGLKKMDSVITEINFEVEQILHIRFVRIVVLYK